MARRYLTRPGSDFPAFARLLVGRVVREDALVVEGQLLGQLLQGERGGLGGVVGPLWRALGPADEDRREGVTARVALGIRVGEELLGEIHREPGLLANFSDA